MNLIRLLPLLLPFVTGCSALHSGGGRVVFLVIVPSLLIFAIGWYLFRKRPDAGSHGGSGKGPRWPDYDDRE